VKNVAYEKSVQALYSSTTGDFKQGAGFAARYVAPVKAYPGYELWQYNGSYPTDGTRAQMINPGPSIYQANTPAPGCVVRLKCTWYNPIDGYFGGEVWVENLAYVKSLQAVYSNKQWDFTKGGSINGKYQSAAGGGYEIWKFETFLKGNNGWGSQFFIKLTITDYDNNKGKNYVVFVPLPPPPPTTSSVPTTSRATTTVLTTTTTVVTTRTTITTPEPPTTKTKTSTSAPTSTVVTSSTEVPTTKVPTTSVPTTVSTSSEMSSSSVVSPTSKTPISSSTTAETTSTTTAEETTSTVVPPPVSTTYEIPTVTSSTEITTETTTSEIVTSLTSISVTTITDTPTTTLDIPTTSTVLPTSTSTDTTDVSSTYTDIFSTTTTIEEPPAKPTSTAAPTATFTPAINVKVNPASVVYDPDTTVVFGEIRIRNIAFGKTLTVPYSAADGQDFSKGRLLRAKYDRADVESGYDIWRIEGEVLEASKLTR
ncbi:hypothetical protein HDU96_004002, partial [Phlyctochytrium bullatum]